MVFDTGFSLGVFILDYSWLKNHPSCIPVDIIPDTVGAGSLWASRGTKALEYPDFYRTVSIGNTDFVYNSLLTYDWKYYMASKTDGLFNMPEQDTIHIWEFNFESNYLEIHPADHFKMPKDCFVLDIEKKENSNFPFYVKVPMHIRSSDGDTLFINCQYCIDMGLADDICFFSDTEPEFFSKRKDAVWTRTSYGFKRHCTVDATLFDRFSIDSLRIYTDSNISNKNINCFIGHNFLKRFNVFFDMKNQRIGLQPVKNFQRIVNPIYKRYYFKLRKNEEGKTLIDFIPDYKENYFKNAGLQEGDEIVKINDLPIQKFTREKFDEFCEMDTIYIHVIRDKKHLQIVIPVDKSLEQGD